MLRKLLPYDGSDPWLCVSFCELNRYGRHGGIVSRHLNTIWRSCVCTWVMVLFMVYTLRDRTSGVLACAGVRFLPQTCIVLCCIVRHMLCMLLLHPYPCMLRWLRHCSNTTE
jgi:hypothetical protein